MHDKLLVTGASGKLGQKVLDELLSTLGIPPNNIIATTRTPESLKKYAEQGVEVRFADFDDE